MKNQCNDGISIKNQWKFIKRKKNENSFKKSMTFTAKLRKTQRKTNRNSSKN